LSNTYSHPVFGNVPNNHLVLKTGTPVNELGDIIATSEGKKYKVVAINNGLLLLLEPMKDEG